MVVLPSGRNISVGGAVVLLLLLRGFDRDLSELARDRAPAGVGGINIELDTIVSFAHVIDLQTTSPS